MAVATHRVLTSISLCVCALHCWPALTAQLLDGFFVVLLHICPMALLGQAFAGWWQSIQETNVFTTLGKPQWRWQHIEYSPQSLALCVCALPCWSALTAQLLGGFFVLLLHFAQWLCWDKPLLCDGKAFRKQMSSQLLASRSGGGSTSSTHLNLSLCLCAALLAGLDCAAIGWFLCVALAHCAVALLGQAFAG